jgi:hypothetical protein
MLQASGPSRHPTSLGQVIGQGFMGGIQGYGQGKQFEALEEQANFRKAQMEELARKTAAGKAQQEHITRFAQSLPEADRPAFLANPTEYLQAFYKNKLDDKPSIVPPGASVLPRGATQPTFTAPFKPEEPKPSPLSVLLKERDALPPGSPMRQFYDEAIKKQSTHQPPIVQLSTGDKKVDEKFAGEFVEFATGGYADVEKQIAQLDDVAKQLESKAGLTGPVVGAMPRHMMAVMNPKALAALESVEEVGQRNLRLILGPQFTEKEGERLISRVYNPMLSEEENLKRVRRLQKQMGDAAKAKLEAAQYFQEHGTLKGWKGKLWTVKDFNVDKDDSPAKSGGPKKGDLQDGWEFMGGDPGNRANWRRK